jgi:2-polyprenyl-3-methyl-5-hydroxy-6-metoxy-1,4-benzoquinol methylase
VVATRPEISEERLVEFYNSSYRESEYAIEVGGKRMEPPIQIPWSGHSFRRFKTFYDALQRLDGVGFDADSKILDMGGYQGMFLYAFQRMFGSQCTLYDYSRSGVEFARRAFDLSGAIVARDIARDVLPDRYDLVTMIHSFEHVREPAIFLAHLRDHILKGNGLLYLEIPNVMAHPLDDPTHFHMYSEVTLTHVLEAHGFDVLLIGTTGFGCEGFIFNTDRQNIYCFARRRAEDSWLTTGPKVSVGHYYAQIRKSHSKVSRAAMRRGVSDLGRPIRQLGARLRRVFF